MFKEINYKYLSEFIFHATLTRQLVRVKGNPTARNHQLVKLFFIVKLFLYTNTCATYRVRIALRYG